MSQLDDDVSELSWKLRVFARLVRAFLRPGRIVVALAGRLGIRYARFLSLRGIATRALERRDHETAARLPRELLMVAEDYRSDWNYGNAIHHGHLLLGRVALARGDVSTAAAELLEAGRTPGSPQLNSFGPNMALARELLQQGQIDPVREYFSLCRRFWIPEFADLKLKEWESDLSAGREPRFGPHLAY
jgi:hypothetical protein